MGCRSRGKLQLVQNLSKALPLSKAPPCRLCLRPTHPASRFLDVVWVVTHLRRPRLTPLH